MNVYVHGGDVTASVHSFVLYKTYESMYIFEL